MSCVHQANDYTVEISKEDQTLEESVDTMALTLLTELRAHDRLKSYSANAVTEALVHVETS